MLHKRPVPPPRPPTSSVFPHPHPGNRLSLRTTGTDVYGVCQVNAGQESRVQSGGERTGFAYRIRLDICLSVYAIHIINHVMYFDRKKSPLSSVSILNIKVFLQKIEISTLFFRIRLTRSPPSSTAATCTAPSWPNPVSFVSAGGEGSGSQHSGMRNCCH